MYMYMLMVLVNQNSKLRPIQSHLRLNFFPLQLRYLDESPFIYDQLSLLK